jgi:hypothetical protein
LKDEKFDEVLFLGLYINFAKRCCQGYGVFLRWKKEINRNFYCPLENNFKPITFKYNTMYWHAQLCGGCWAYPEDAAY